MSLTVTIPYKTAAAAVYQSDFFSIHNPLLVKVERKDYAVVDTQDDGAGNTQINVTGTPPALTVGGTLFVNVGTFGSGLCGNFDILSNSGSAIIIDEPYTSPFTGGYVNLITDRPNYYVYTKIQLSLPAILTQFGELQTRYRQDRLNNLGVGYIDLSPQMKVDFHQEDEYDYDGINSKDLNDCCQYGVYFQEVWDASTEVFSSEYNIDAVNAAQQIPKIQDLQFSGQLRDTGSNMIEYVMFVDNNLLNEIALFLTDSRRPTHYPGLPFDLQILSSLQVYDWLQSSGALTVSQIVMRDNTTLTTTTIAFSEAIGLDSFYQRLQIPSTSFATGATHLIYYISMVDGAMDLRLTEQLHVKLKDIPCNPVYLRWNNSLGGWNYYCFSARQIHGQKTASLGEFSQTLPDVDISDQTTTSSFIGKTSEPYMTVGAEQLDSYDIALMESLVASPFVEILYNIADYMEDNTEPLKWMEVKIDVGDMKGRDTKKTLNTFECKVRFAEKQLQRR